MEMSKRVNLLELKVYIRYGKCRKKISFLSSLQDLRETLERERERILTLRAQLNEAVNKQMSVKSGTSRASARARNSDILESNIRSPGEDVKVSHMSVFR